MITPFATWKVPELEDQKEEAGERREGLLAQLDIFKPTVVTQLHYLHAAGVGLSHLGCLLAQGMGGVHVNTPTAVPEYQLLGAGAIGGGGGVLAPKLQGLPGASDWDIGFWTRSGLTQQGSWALTGDAIVILIPDFLFPL